MEHIITLFLLILLQCVLGFDNLLYISLESKRAPLEKQASVRKIGIIIAIFLRIALLFILVNLIESAQAKLFDINLGDSGEYVYGIFNLHSLIVLAGGIFIMYTAVKEIWHMMKLEEHEEIANKKPSSTNKVITMIVIMNLVFSFDSILSAIALTDVMWVMTTAIVVSGLLMIYLADRVSTFLEKNRMYEVLGLFVLFLVGIMLITEGAHLANLTIWGSEIEQMSKATFYFVLFILVVVDVVQGRYQKKLSAQKH